MKNPSVVLLTALLVLVQCALLAQLTDTKTVIYPAPQGITAIELYTVTVNDRPVFVYPVNLCPEWPGERLPPPRQVFEYTDSVRKRGPVSFAYFDFAGTVTVRITSQRPVSQATIRPLSAGITPTVAGDVISFNLTKPCNLSVEVNGSDKPLFIFANPLEVDPPKPGDPNVIYFGPGIHQVGKLSIKSNTTVYIAGGAVVQGMIVPGERPNPELSWAGQRTYGDQFIAYRANHVTIRGRGILEGSSLPWHARMAISIIESTNVRVDGIILVDMPCWNINIRSSENVSITNVRQICGRENSDGIDICSSRNVLVDGCFLRNNDDEVTIKTIKPPATESNRILVRNCVIWNDRAIGLGITYETRVDVRNVLFQNCDIIHDTGLASLGVHVSDSGTMRDIGFENIRIEDTRNRVCYLAIVKDFWGRDPERGHIKGVTFKNISVVDGPFAKSTLDGADANHLVEDVTFQNYCIRGEVVRSALDGDIRIGAFARNVRFVVDDNPPVIAPKLTSVQATPGNPQVALSWTPLENQDPPVARYFIFRNGEKVGESANASFIDPALDEETEYGYSVAAVNIVGAEGPSSEAVQVKTLRDSAAPEAAGVAALDATHLRVIFTEKIDPAGMGKVESYRLFCDSEIVATATAMAADGQSVMLTTTPMTERTRYALDISGITDRTPPPTIAVKILDATHVNVTFNGNVDPAIAVKAESYRFYRDIEVKAATAAADGRSVMLTTAPLDDGVRYTLAISGIRDHAHPPHDIAANTTISVMLPPLLTGLIGWWRLDEGAGAVVHDASAQSADGAIRPAAAWAVEENRTGLRFNGDQGYAVLGNPPALRSVQENNYTIAAWFKPEGVPAGSGYDYNMAYGIVTKKGWHEGLYYSPDGRFGIWHWLAGDKQASTGSYNTFRPGRFYHLTGVVDRNTGEVRIYVNGLLEGRSAFPANAVTRPFGNEPWHLGTADENSHASCGCPARGILSDVRIYNRVLNKAEIEELAFNSR